MVQEALRVVTKEHATVVIWCDTRRNVDQIVRTIFTSVVEGMKLRVRTVSWGQQVYVGKEENGSILVYAASVATERGNLHHDPGVRGASKDTVYLADHHLTERMSPWLLSQWARFR